MNTAGDTLRKYWRLILLIAGIVTVSWLVYALRHAIFPFILGLVLVYLLLPVISWVEKKLPRQDRWLQVKRTSLIVVFLALIFGLVGLFFYFFATTLIGTLSDLAYNAPQFISQSLNVVREWAMGLHQFFPIEMQQQVDAFVMEMAVGLGNSIKEAFMQWVPTLPRVVDPLLSLIALPIFLFYILRDSEKLQTGFYSALSPWLADHIRNILAIVGEVLGRYVRAQLLLGFIVGYLCFIGLFIMRIRFAPTLAIIAGVTELIPLLGPWIGGAFAFIVTLATEPAKALWVVLLYIVVQLLENNLLVPRIQGHYLRIHPAITLFLLVLGAYVAGFWGIILIVPLTATTVEIYRYLRRSAEKERTAQLPLTMN